MDKYIKNSKIKKDVIKEFLNLSDYNSFDIGNIFEVYKNIDIIKNIKFINDDDRKLVLRKLFYRYDIYEKYYELRYFILESSELPLIIYNDKKITFGNKEGEILIGKKDIDFEFIKLYLDCTNFNNIKKYKKDILKKIDKNKFNNIFNLTVKSLNSEIINSDNYNIEIIRLLKLNNIFDINGDYKKSELLSIFEKSYIKLLNLVSGDINSFIFIHQDELANFYLKNGFSIISLINLLKELDKIGESKTIGYMNKSNQKKDINQTLKYITEDYLNFNEIINDNEKKALEEYYMVSIINESNIEVFKINFLQFCNMYLKKRMFNKVDKKKILEIFTEGFIKNIKLGEVIKFSQTFLIQFYKDFSKEDRIKSLNKILEIIKNEKKNYKG